MTPQKKQNISDNYFLTYKINPNGLIIEGNERLEDQIGFKINEFIDEKQELIMHSDMPKIFLSLINESLKTKKSFFCVIKLISKYNLSKLFLAHFNWNKLKKEFEVTLGNISPKIEIIFNALYLKLCKIEKFSNIKTAKKYLNGFFEYKKIKDNQTFIFKIFGKKEISIYRTNRIASKKSKIDLNSNNLFEMTSILDQINHL